MDFQYDVVVVGAGGGGAILGLDLGRKGIKTLVLEQAPGPPTGLRGEILQPNGQKVFDNLGLLEKLPSQAVKPVRLFHFHQIGGARMCTVDYDMLPPPYNRALVTLPNVVHHTVLEKLQAHTPGGLWYGTSFTRLIKRGDQVVGVEAETQGRSMTISAKLVVGADGPFSKVRDALGIPTSLHHYSESYLLSILDCPDGLEEAQYFLGRKEIFGIFPAAGGKVYLFYMIGSGSMPVVQASGLQALRIKWTAIYPELKRTFQNLVEWKQTANMPTGRARAKSWVRDGAVLIGDAAHGMNPHASQGRMQAMVDAVTLAELIPSCLEREDFSASALRAYEDKRRPHVEMLQRLADVEVFFWNTGNPILATIRNRVFSTLDRNRRLRYQVLSATAGLRETPPFGLVDRFQAIGVLPDPRADDLPPDTLPVRTRAIP